MFFCKCRKYAIGAVAAGAACTVCGEIIAATEPASHVKLYIAADSGADQAHDHREPKAPTPTRALEIRAVSSSAAFTAIQSIPSSIASSPMFWQAPTYPAPGRDYVVSPALLLTARSS
jgi:hypothetical protein